MRGEVVERVPKGMMASLPIEFKKLVSSQLSKQAF